MTVEKIRKLRQALLDNAAGNPLASVHRNDLFDLLDECESAAMAPPPVTVPETVQ